MIVASSDDTTQAHIAHVRKCSSVQLAFEALASVLPSYGLQYVAVGHLVNPLMYRVGEKTLAMSNWNPKWVQHWIENNYMFHDPISYQVVRRIDPFFWSDIALEASPRGQRILAEAKDYGLGDGLSIPVIRPHGPRGCVSLANKTGSRPDIADMAAITSLARAAFMHLDALAGPFEFDVIENFTDREIEVLYMAAAGKTNWEAGRMLLISEHSVRDHLRAIFKKLNVANRTQAVARAIQLGLIIP